MEKELLDILVCPICKVNLSVEDRAVLCKECGRTYPVKEGVPDMLIDETDEDIGE